MIRRPNILYYNNGQTEKGKVLEKAARRMGFDFTPILPQNVLQTVGYLAKIKGFPQRKISVLENLPSIPVDVMVMCNFTDDNLNHLLRMMKNGELPSVALKAVLTSQNCFWTFAHLVKSWRKNTEILWREKKEEKIRRRNAGRMRSFPPLFSLPLIFLLIKCR